MTNAIRYVPILRWKQGERTALQNISAAGRAQVCPLIILNPGQYGDTKPPRAPPKRPPKTAPLSASDAFAKHMQQAWGADAIMLDASNLLGTLAHHHLDDIAASARAIGLTIIPATLIDAPPEYQAAVARMAAADQRGVALRLMFLRQMTSASSWAPTWPFALADTDLIIDLAGSVANVASLGVPLAQAFAGLHQANAWRSVTLAGGCIPPMLTNWNPRTIWPREELALWRMLNGQGLPYQLDFGDYTSVSPDLSDDPIGGPTPINGKYSLIDDFLIFHGVKTTGPSGIDQDVQLRDYARQIVAHTGRTPLAHCWGDGRFDGIAASATSNASSPGGWVGFNVNRHIEITRHTLP
jgi:hypothetical protein